MGRLSFAIRSFFSLLFKGKLPDEVVAGLGLTKRVVVKAPSAPVANTAADGAVQTLALLQRDARLVDFLMEDISAYSDEQVGAAVRNLHGQCREVLKRHMKLESVIDGVEGTFVSLANTERSEVRLIGNVRQDAPSGGVLRHKGWRAVKVDLPPILAKGKTALVAQAEVEIE